MIDVEREVLLSLSEAAKVIPGRPNCSTIWRWCRSGVGKVVLESITIGGRRYTSSEAIQRFIFATTAASAGTARKLPRTNRQAEAEVGTARQFLNSKGFPPART